MIASTLSRAARSLSAHLARLRDARLAARVDAYVSTLRLDVPVSVFRPRDGVGVQGVMRLGFDLGRIDVFAEGGRIRTVWRGTDQHAVPDRECTATTMLGFAEQLHGLTRRYFLNMRRPEAGPHHMLI